MNNKPYDPWDEWWQKQAKKKRAQGKIVERPGKTYNVIGQMDTCHYCGRTFHPMPRWTQGDNLICVCYDQVWPDAEPQNCTQKAVEDGYTKRQDLTPRR